MLRIKQLLYREDNFSYILYNNKNALIIDPGCPEKIMEFVKSNNLNILQIVNTHTHFDHIMGNEVMEKLSSMKVSNMETVIENRFISMDENKIEVIFTPGHTMDSVCYYSEGLVVTGDTLFIANIGNCFTEKYQVYKKSLDKLLNLPDNTVVYPGHDYTERSLKRVLTIEPGNKYAQEFWENYNPPPVCSTIKDEKNINPYLRAQTEELKQHLMANDKDVTSDFNCFKSFIELY